MTALVVSDVHIDASRPAVATRFAEFLASEAAAASALYVLGDLFETWVGDDDPDPHRRAVIAALGELAARGTAIYFMHGNRDFLLGERFCRDTGGELLVDPTLVERDGRRVLLTHGDALCTDDAPYQKLRALVRDPTWQRQFLKLSLRARQSLAREARAGSQTHTAAQQPMLLDVNDLAVADLFRRSGVETILHGHTHRPGIYHHEVDGHLRTRIVTGDWYSQGSVLRWDAAGLRLETLSR